MKLIYIHLFTTSAGVGLLADAVIFALQGQDSTAFAIAGVAILLIEALLLYKEGYLHRSPEWYARKAYRKIMQSANDGKIKEELIQTPFGTMKVSLKYERWMEKWRVAIPTNLSGWAWSEDCEYIYFDDYDEALKFFERVVAELRRLFEEVRR